MSDLISRQKVLNTLDFADNALTDEERTVETYKELLTECIKVLPSAENKGDLISRQAVMDALCDSCELFKNGEQTCRSKCEEYHFLATLSSVENMGEWIPVSERLPLLRGLYKISDDVLITNGYEINMGYLVERKGKIFWHYYGSECEVGIKDEDNDEIAWMPLPEPYKTEKPETCKGCLEPCIMYEADMRGCKNKVTERGE